MRQREDSLSLLDVGRRMNNIGIKYARVEEAQSRMPEGSKQYCAAHARLVHLMSEQTALQDLALAMQARSLTDAAVQLCILFDALAEVCFCDLASQAQSGHLGHDLEKFRRVLAGVTLAVADAAGLELQEVGEPDLMTRLS
jgi:hypothetical protein